MITLPEGSWGEGGFHWIWFNDQNSWTWKHIYSSERRFLGLLDRFREKPAPEAERVLRQAGRELLLMESSDWQFLISTWAARDYAEHRLAGHAAAFESIADIAQRCLDNGGLTDADRNRLEDAETIDDIFPHLELSWWDLDH
jgi:1,4-alpha-glucan branching enzyme